MRARLSSLITAAAAICAVAVIVLSALPAVAGQHCQRPRSFCAPVLIEGVGTFRICAPARGR